mmetsp:Transcript_79924/g.120121  ORF Transcript_79924/g.120121 Transcript_79924/m.120121 type:complete len:463 (+) Transcript_79924:126-1514(+)
MDNRGIHKQRNVDDRLSCLKSAILAVHEATLLVGLAGGTVVLVGDVLGPVSIVAVHTDDSSNSNGQKAIVPVVPVSTTSDHGGNGEGDNGHKLDKDVKCRARGILEGITNSVSNNACLVGLGTLTSVGAHDFDELLGVIPGTSSSTHHDSKHSTGSDGTAQHTSQAAGSNQEPHHDRGKDGVGSGENHLLNGRHSADLDTSLGIRLSGTLHESLNGVELTANLLNDGSSGLTNGKHSEGSEKVGEHGTKEHAREHNGVTHVDQALDIGLGLESGEQGDSSKNSRSNGESLSGGGGGVSEGIKIVSDLTNALIKSSHLGNTSGVISNRTVSISGEGDSKGGKHTDGGNGNTVLASEGVATQDSNHNHKDRTNSGNHAYTKTLNDNSGGTSGTGVSDRHNGSVRERSKVFSKLTDENTAEQANDNASEASPAIRLTTIKKNVANKGSRQDDKDRSGMNSLVEGM